MTIWKPLRMAFIKTTDFTHGYQGSTPAKLRHFYRLWAPVYDLTVRLDPAYLHGLKHIVTSVVGEGDMTLDVGSGTGLGSELAACVADRVVAIDPSQEMLAKLHKRIRRRHLENVEVRQGYFPDVLVPGESFDSIISSFMLAHLGPKQRANAIAAMFHCLKQGGHLGLFAAQGEIAPTFQTRDEVEGHLLATGFVNAKITDLWDIYRVTTAMKP